MQKILRTALVFSFVFSSAFINALTQRSVDDALRIVEERNIRFVEFTFIEMTGGQRGLLVPACEVENAFKNGIFFDGSSIAGYTSISESDMLAMPDPSTLTFNTGNDTAHCLCTVHTNKNTPYAGDPRHILQNALDRVHAFGLEFFVGPELEFFLLHQDQNTGRLLPCDSTRYFDVPTHKNAANAQQELLTRLLNNGVPFEKLHSEVAPGQYEGSLHYDTALAMADALTMAKRTIRSFAHENGLVASFMPKPLGGQNGNGMHIHFSLYAPEEKENVFHDANAQHNLSQQARHFIAGVLAHAHELTAILNPTINSFKRLVPGYEAPIFVCWGTKNRSALIRIPEVHNNQPQAVRAELRSADPSCNPYLAFAMILHAGLDGIEKEMALSQQVDESTYKMSDEKRAELGITQLPTSPEATLELLKKSAFLRTYLGDTLLNEMIAHREKELDGYRNHITSWEYSAYL